MRRFADALVAVGVVAVLAATGAAPARAGIVSSGLGVLSGIGGGILGAGRTLACAGLSAAGTVAQGAGAVGGAAVGGAATEGVGAAEGAAAGGAVGGIVKRGAGAISGALCGSGSGAGSGLAGTVLKTVVGGAAAAATFDLAARWIIAAARRITGAIVSMISTSTSPQLTAAWFERSFAPMAALGAALALLVTLISLTSAAVRRDPAALAGTLHGIVRAAVGAALLIAFTTLALQITDAISADVIAGAHQAFWSQVSHAWGAGGFGGFGSSALAMLIAIVQILAGVVVWLELAVRSAAIYLTVLFFPVALAASIWPALAGWTSRLARLLLLFVILKPVTLIVLAFAGNAAMAGLSLNGSLASSAGTIIAAVTIFALAAMAPWALMLIVAADSESAAVGAGVRAAAGHARSDGAAALSRAGGRLSSGAARAGGALGAAGGAIRGVAAGRRGGGGSGPGGGSDAGGGRPSGPAGGPSGQGDSGGVPPTGGGGPVPAGVSSGSFPAARGRGVRSADRTNAPTAGIPVGAVALAAGLTAQGAAGAARGGGAIRAPGARRHDPRHPTPGQTAPAPAAPLQPAPAQTTSAPTTPGRHAPATRRPAARRPSRSQ